MHMNEKVAPYVTTFIENRKLTYDLLDALAGDDLRRDWPRPGLDTFEKHFLEMASVQRVFVDAMVTGKIDFSSVPDVFEFRGSKDKSSIREALEDEDRRLDEVSQGDKLKSEVDWDGTPLPLEIHLTNLISHEIFHQGMMAMVCYMFEIRLPESWTFNWAMPQVGTTAGMAATS